MENTLRSIAQRLADGETDAEILVDEALSRARKTKNVFTSLFDTTARIEASASVVRRKRGESLGPLDGIPIAIKDLLDVKGRQTLAGSLTRTGIDAAKFDAPVVLALRKQGMIPLGKTNLSEFAFSGLGLNPHFGTPFPDFPNTEARVPGGSSSGSAVAVQRNVVAAAIGTDTGGSVRVPAAFNGLVGFKGSSGRYDLRGVHALAPTLDSLGPIAHTADDCAMLDAAMRGVRNTTSAIQLAKIRLVADTALLEDPGLQPEVRDNLLAMLNCLRDAGAKVEFRAVPAVARVREVISQLGWLGAVEAWGQLKDIMEGAGGQAIDRRIRARLVAASQIHDDIARQMREARDTLMPLMRLDLDGAVLVLPTVKHVAPLLGPIEEDDDMFAASNASTLANTMIGSFLDMPGIAIPSGTGEAGLPTSALFALPRGNDDAVLNVGLAVEQQIRGVQHGSGRSGV